MSRRHETRCLRFYERGHCRWVEFITESHPTRAPRGVVIGDRLVDDFGTQFRSTALCAAPRILFFEEVASVPAHPGAELPAFQARVLHHLDDILGGRAYTSRTLRAVQPLAQLLARRSKFRAFVDLPLPRRLKAIDRTLVCVICSRATSDTDVVALSGGWGCLQGPWSACWFCANCYGPLMAQHPESIHAWAWRAAQAAKQQLERLIAAVQLVDDVAAVRRVGDEDALARLTERVAARWKPTLDPDVHAALKQRATIEGATPAKTKRGALAAAILMTAEREQVLQPMKFGDGTTLRDEAGETARVRGADFTLPLFDRWFTNEAISRASTELVEDAPEVARGVDHRDDIADLLDPRADPLAALLEVTSAVDLAEMLDPLTRFSPEQRRVLRKALADDLPLEAAARALGMSRATATKQIARIRQKARSFLRQRLKTRLKHRLCQRRRPIE